VLVTDSKGKMLASRGFTFATNFTMLDSVEYPDIITPLIPYDDYIESLDASPAKEVQGYWM